MIKELMYKWFGLEPAQCPACEVLREALASSERERRELLQRVLTPIEPTSTFIEKEEPVAITPQFIPWRVRQQMLEAEDRKKMELMKKHADSIDKLEEELGVKSDAAQ